MNLHLFQILFQFPFTQSEKQCDTQWREFVGPVTFLFVVE